MAGVDGSFSLSSLPLRNLANDDDGEDEGARGLRGEDEENEGEDSEKEGGAEVVRADTEGDIEGGSERGGEEGGRERRDRGTEEGV